MYPFWRKNSIASSSNGGSNAFVYPDSVGSAVGGGRIGMDTDIFGWFCGVFCGVFCACLLI